MRVARVALSVAVLCAAGLSSPQVSAREASGVAHEESARYIVVLEERAHAGRVSAVHAAAFGFRLLYVYRHALKGYAASMSHATAATIAEAPDVASVQRDRVLRLASQRTPSGVDRVDADLSPTAAINGDGQRVDVDVAVLDTGIDSEHRDLNVHVSAGRNCTVPGIPVSVLPTGDDNGHGTHVAGTIGALDNDFGVVGVAPGARLWPVKVLLRDGRGLDSMLLCGIDYVTANASEIEVANLSLVRSGSDDQECGRVNEDALHQAICGSVGLGVSYVVAAGNEHEDANQFVPAAYDEVITVSALADFDGQPSGGAEWTCYRDRDDTFANFSNFGSDVDVIAPGVCIDSTVLGGGYEELSGTSMASAHVAGAAALYRASRPGATPQEISQSLRGGRVDWKWPSQDGDRIRERRLDVGHV